MIVSWCLNNRSFCRLVKSLVKRFACFFPSGCSPLVVPLWSFPSGSYPLVKLPLWSSFPSGPSHRVLSLWSFPSGQTSNLVRPDLVLSFWSSFPSGPFPLVLPLWSSFLITFRIQTNYSHFEIRRPNISKGIHSR